MHHQPGPPAQLATRRSRGPQTPSMPSLFQTVDSFRRSTVIFIPQLTRSPHMKTGDTTTSAELGCTRGHQHSPHGDANRPRAPPNDACHLDSFSSSSTHSRRLNFVSYASPLANHTDRTVISIPSANATTSQTTLTALLMTTPSRKNPRAKKKNLSDEKRSRSSRAGGRDLRTKEATEAALLVLANVAIQGISE